MTEPLIQFKQVFKRFGDNAVLKGVDLSIYQGQVTTIIGKCGIGKSVLLKHIIGLLQPDENEILSQGQAALAMTPSKRKALKIKFSYMFQGTALFDSMTVYDNAALPLKELVQARFDSVSGLKSGAKIDLAGVEVGQVADIRLDTERQMAIVDMKTKKGVVSPMT